MRASFWGILALATATFATGCGAGAGKPEELGQLSVPLVTHGPSGTEYRLRNATFEIYRYDYYYWGAGGMAAGAAGGEASYPPAGAVTTVSSEDDPTADSIVVDLEQGDYYVTLLPGWNMEKIEGNIATPIETTLLSSETTWVYVYPRSTTWVEYLFGVGGRELWLNGKLNIGIQVAEDPNAYYGGGGAGGGLSTGGAWAGETGGFANGGASGN
jgi:hypothetical protein